MSNDERDLTTTGETTPSIPEHTIQNLLDFGDDVTLFCRLVRGGFQFTNQDKIVPELVGQIKAINLYIAKFPEGGGQPEKRPWVKDDIDIPPGFQRRGDIKIKTGGQVLGLSLAPSSLKYHLSKYVEYLENQGLKPSDVITRVTSKQASNNMGTFQVAVFEMVDGEKKPSDTSEAYAPVDQYPGEWD